MKRIIIATLLGLVRNIESPRLRAEALDALERFAFLLFEDSPLGSVGEEFGDDLMVAAQQEASHAAA